jgi:MYXO-CTERM domain-containing protein
VDADSGSATRSTFTYNAWYNNSADDASGDVNSADLAAATGNIFTDPDLYDDSLDGDCTNDVLFPNGSSPLINAGDPSLTDADGSISDIGAYGGAGADIDDADGDGYASPIDCDDTDASIHPGALEVIDDGIDQDCDGADLTADADADGHISEATGGDDCDDTDATVNPDQSEVPYDGVDNDCDPATSDSDVDGHDAEAVGGDDCDDTDAAINPEAAEVWYDGVDQDCSGGSDHDQDGDGHDAVASGGDDCDDLDATRVTPADCASGGDTGDTDLPGAKDTGDPDARGDCGCATEGGTAIVVPVVLLAAFATRRRRR